jgi:hypothetical protein
MGFLRNPGDEPGGKRFFMGEELLAIGDDFWIENEQGERAYKVNGEAVRFRVVGRGHDEMRPFRPRAPSKSALVVA